MEQGMVIQSSGIFKGLTKILITINIKSAWLVVLSPSSFSCKGADVTVNSEWARELGMYAGK